MATVKILIRKNYQKKDGTYPIALRITQNRKTRFIFTGKYIFEKDWDASKGLSKKSHPNSKRLNNLLLKKLSEAHGIALEAEEKDGQTTVKSLKKKINNNQDLDFFSVSQSYLDAIEKRKKFNQKKSDEGRLNIFKAFLKRDDLAFGDLNVALLNKFQNHLRFEKKRSERTIANYMVLIRTIYNRAISQSIIGRELYPFGKDKIQIKIPESEKIGLNIEEIQSLEKAENITPAQQHAVNIWLFSFYFAGVRVGDLLKLRWSDFKDNRLYYRMGKNKKLVSLKVPEKALVILVKYKAEKSRKDDFIFPDLKGTDSRDEKRMATRIKSITRNLNRRLAMVASTLEIEKKLSMHIARHSFGNISGDKIPIQMLQKLYRHSSITTTINYQANFMHKETDEALDKVVNF